MDDEDLDQLSTSQTTWERCAYGAPLVALIFRGQASIKQACCNHWDCPACGKERAKQEYRRIVFGAECLADEGHKLYFWTITCRGRELNYDDAMVGYYSWTNKLLTSARTKCKRAEGFWSYVQVTEHQKKTRAHPHSHLITTYCPDDALWSLNSKLQRVATSQWFTSANVRAGLGEQCRISEVGDASAVSRYIAKYLFKAALTETWPPGWKRVRYSENWPKQMYQKAEIAIVLQKPQDWERAASEQTTWYCRDDRIFEIAYHHIANIRKQPIPIDF